MTTLTASNVKSKAASLLKLIKRNCVETPGKKYIKNIYTSFKLKGTKDDEIMKELKKTHGKDLSKKLTVM